MALSDTVRTTLGPRGMDKLIHDDKVRLGRGLRSGAGWHRGRQQKETTRSSRILLHSL